MTVLAQCGRFSLKPNLRFLGNATERGAAEEHPQKNRIYRHQLPQRRAHPYVGCDARSLGGPRPDKQIMLYILSLVKAGLCCYGISVLSGRTHCKAFVQRRLLSALDFGQDSSALLLQPKNAQSAPRQRQRLRIAVVVLGKTTPRTRRSTCPATKP